MEITSVGANGSVTIRMTADEAKAVRDDLGKTWSKDISGSSDTLYRLLAAIHGDAEVSR